MKSSYTKLLALASAFIALIILIKIFPVKTPFAVKNIEENYNLKVEIAGSYKEIYPGKELWFTTKVMNFKNDGRKDISLKYSIIDNNKKAISSKTETMAIETQASFVGKIKIPEDAPAGKYELLVELLANNERKAQGNDSFIVLGKKKDSINYAIYIAISGIVVIFFIVLLVKSKNSFEKMRIKKQIKKIVKRKLNENQ